MIETIRNKRFGLIGAGRVGSFFAALLKKKGLRVVGVSDINEKRAVQLSRWLGLKGKNWRSRDLAEISDVLFCATPDDVIIEVYEEIKDYLKPGAIFCHFSGSLSRNAFSPQAAVLSLHPIYTLTKRDRREIWKKGEEIEFPFALEGDERAINFGKRLMKAIGGNYILIPTEKKEIYHLACVFASNFLWSTLRVAFHLIQDIVDDYHILLPLASASLNNTFSYPPKLSATGPIVRGDKETIKKHIRVLKERFPQYLSLYKSLSQVIFRLLKEEIPAEARREMERLIHVTR
ncbi:MAG: DUF2520 domain-containing protein [candidate division WOR-3 bacterium]